MMNIRDITRTVEAHQLDDVPGIQAVLEMVEQDLTRVEQDILEHGVLGAWNFTIQDQGFLCEGLHAVSDFALQGNPVVHLMALHYPGSQLKPQTWGDEINLREEPGRLAEWGVERVQAYAVWRTAHPELAAPPVHWLRGLDHDDEPGD